MRRFFAKVIRLNGTPLGIAGGFALGFACSLIPIPVAGMLVALALAPVFGLNLPATYLGSAVVNPVTGPAFYFAELWVGMWLFGRALPSWTSVKAFSGSEWLDLFLGSLPPFLLGAAVMVVAAAMVSMVTLYPAVRRFQGVAGGRAKESSEDSTSDALQ